MTPQAQEPRATPYPGLRPFEADEAHLFFGRDEQSDELLRRLRLHRFLALVGSSGSGKSSLVKAGLLPALLGGFMVRAGAAWRIATLRPGANPIGNLAAALNAPDVFGSTDGASGSPISLDRFTEVTLRRGPLGLIEATRHAGLAPDENLLVLVDQFEELFRFARLAAPGREDDPAAFVTMLLEAAAVSDGPIFVVITMRSEFLGDCGRFRGLAEAINQGQYLVPRLTRDQMREAIVGPASLGGADVTPRLVQRLLADAGDEPDQLPVLQHALMRTWDLWTAAGDTSGNGRGPLDLPAYAATGGMSEALSRHANEIYDSLPDARSREIAKVLFQQLTERREGLSTRRPTRLADICEVAGATEQEVIRVVEPFRRDDRSFLMPSGVPLDANTTLDISHESLIRVWDKLKTWTDDEQMSADLYRRLAEAAALYDAGAGSLWRGPELDLGLAWREKHRPTETWARRYNPAFGQAMTFLTESERAREAYLAAQKKTRRTRRLIVATVIAVISASTGATLLQMLEARRAREAEYGARILSTQSVRDPLTRALLLSALESHVTAEHLPILQEAAAAPIPLAVLPATNDNALAAAFIDKEHVATLSASGILRTSRSDGKGRPREVRIMPPLADAASVDGGAATLPAIQRGAFSPDGKWIAVVLSTGAVWMGRSDRTSESTPLRVSAAPPALGGPTIAALAFSRDSRQIAAGYSDYTVRVWRLSQPAEGFLTTTPAVIETGHTGAITSLDFDPTGTRLATASWDGTSRIWNLTGGKMIGNAIAAGEGGIITVAFSPDGAWLLCGDDKGIVRLWRTARPSVDDALMLAGHEGGVNAASFSPDGSKVVTGSKDRRARMWSLRSVEGNVEANVKGSGDASRTLLSAVAPAVLTQDNDVTAVRFSEDGTKLLTAYDDGGARIWSSDAREPRVLGIHDGRVDSVGFNRDATHVLSAANDKTARVWEIAVKGHVRTLDGHNDWVRSAAPSPADDRTLLTASDDGTVRFWNLTTGKTRVSQEHGRVFMASFDREGARVVTAVADNVARIWRVGPLGLEGPLNELRHSDWVLSAAFSADGSRVVTASKDGATSVWTLASGTTKPTDVFAPQVRTQVYSASFNPDASRIVATSADGLARIWSTTGKGDPLLLRHKAGDVYKASFNTAGDLVVTASSDGTARIWTVKDGAEQAVLDHGSEAVRAAAFSPSGKEVVTGTSDGVLRLWRVTLPALREYLTNATTACLRPAVRIRFLGEDPGTAQSRYDECETGHERKPR